MALYCDTNLLIRLYVEFPTSALALQQLSQSRRRGPARIPITWLHQLELINAFEQLVFLTRNGDGLRMTPEKAVLAAAQFEEDLAHSHGLESVPLATNDLLKQTRVLAHRHTAQNMDFAPMIWPMSRPPCSSAARSFGASMQKRVNSPRWKDSGFSQPVKRRNRFETVPFCWAASPRLVGSTPGNQRVSKSCLRWASERFKMNGSRFEPERLQRRSNEKGCCHLQLR